MSETVTIRPTSWIISPTSGITIENPQNGCDGDDTTYMEVVALETSTVGESTQIKYHFSLPERMEITSLQFNIPHYEKVGSSRYTIAELRIYADDEDVLATQLSSGASDWGRTLTPAGASGAFEKLTSASDVFFSVRIQITRYKTNRFRLYDLNLVVTGEPIPLTNKVKVNGSWVEAEPYVKVNGTWEKATNAFVKVNGSWEEVT